MQCACQRFPLHTLKDVRERSLFQLARVVGVGYGSGFGDACRGLEATNDACDAAWQEAVLPCVELPGADPLCLNPLPGYFSLPDDLDTRVRGLFAERVEAAFHSLPCANPASERVRRLCERE